MKGKKEQTLPGEEGKRELGPLEEGMAFWLRQAGQALPHVPLSPEEEARVWQALRPVVEGLARQPPLRERLAQWLQKPAASLRSLGTVALRLPARPMALAAAGPEEAPASEAEGPWIQTVRSDDLGLVATVLVTRQGEIWVGFETEDPALAGKRVRFALREPEAGEPTRAGEVTLEPAGPGRWEGRQRLGERRALPLSTEVVLDFAIVEE